MNSNKDSTDHHTKKLTFKEDLIGFLKFLGQGVIGLVLLPFLILKIFLLSFLMAAAEPSDPDHKIEELFAEDPGDPDPYNKTFS